MTTQERNQINEDNLLDALRAGQEKVVDIAHELADTVGEVLPDVWNEPLADGVPAVGRITDSAFKLVHGILDAQHEMTVKVVGTVADSVRQIVDGGERKATAPKRAPATTKARARRAADAN